MYKFAVTREILERIAKRIPTRIIKPKKSHGFAGSAFVQTMKIDPGFTGAHKQYLEGLRQTNDIPYAKRLTADIAKSELHLRRVLARRANKLMDRSKVDDLINQMREHKDYYRANAKLNRAQKTLDQYKDSPPKLFPHKKGTVPINMAPGNYKFIPEHKEANRLARSVVKLHEMDEILTVPQRSSSFAEAFHHNSPAVILREHNNLTTIPASTPGKSALIDKFFFMRQNREIPTLFPQGGFSHGISPRLSRHAIKRLTQDYARRNPSL